MRRCFVCLLLFFNHAYAAKMPVIYFFNFSVPPVANVYPKESVKLPLVMSHAYLKKNKWWILPANTRLEAVNGICPAIPGDGLSYADGVCYLNLVVSGQVAGQVISGTVTFRQQGKDHGTSWNDFINSPYFTVNVLPHPLSMVSPGKAMAVAGRPFHFSFIKYIRFFDENMQSGATPIGIVSPQKKNGLHFDPASYSIVGIPEQIGTSTFQIAVKNQHGMSAAVELIVEVGVNLQDKPKFKPNFQLASANPGQPYTLSLMNLVKKESLVTGDQLHFRIKPYKNNSPYFSINNQNDKWLVGHVPANEAGRTLQTTIIAHSNTGGDSKPLTLKIPVAFDPALTPSIRAVSLTTNSHQHFYADLISSINDPSRDGSLQLILKKIKPDAPWLKRSMQSPTALEGLVPSEATGMHYKLYLQAVTITGGSSETTEGVLNVNINPDLTPRFKMEKPILPVLLPDTAYRYCFHENRDIYPEFEDYPYSIELAKDHDNPPWLKIEKNCIEVNNVPSDLEFYPDVWLRIRNTPGGISKAYYVELPIAGLTKKPDF